MADHGTAIPKIDGLLPFLCICFRLLIIPRNTGTSTHRHSLASVGQAASCCRSGSGVPFSCPKDWKEPLNPETMLLGCTAGFIFWKKRRSSWTRIDLKRSQMSTETNNKWEAMLARARANGAALKVFRRDAWENDWRKAPSFRYSRGIEAANPWMPGFLWYCGSSHGFQYGLVYVCYGARCERNGRWRWSRCGSEDRRLGALAGVGSCPTDGGDALESQSSTSKTSTVEVGQVDGLLSLEGRSSGRFN